MIDRRGFLGSLLAGFVIAPPAAAGVTDWFNGVKLGATMPDHDATFVQGAWNGSASLVLVDFWATWCAPCITAIPHLNAIHDRFTAEGLHVVGVSDETVEVVALFVTRKGMRYAVAAGGERPLRKTLKVRALPYAMLVDARRRIVWRGQPEQLDDATLRAQLDAVRAAG
ncbi:MAG: TlpA family protein disulfide reductase [Xanthomonadaceae bacterium]|jgi:thiol-disulfide isomerase/thioredoxin|nr:TlpA family protein disulfide reductase [Xanthomonadaceae bacterium]